MKQYFYLFLLLVLGGGTASAQSSLNISQIGHLDYDTLNLNDVWAYVDSSGNEWALVGTVAGASIVDLSDPANPVEKFFMHGDYTFWRDVKAYGAYAYITAEDTAGLRIIDLSQLPNSIQWKDTIYNGINRSHNVSIEQGYLYLSGISGSGGIAVLDANQDPWNPSLISTWDSLYCHDLYVRNDTGYAAFVQNGLGVIDFSDKSNPELIASVSYPDAVTHNTWLNDAGNICFTTDETYGGRIIAWDLSDLQNISRTDDIGSLQSMGQEVPHNALVKNDFVYTSYYRDGLVIFDGSRPNNLVEIAHFNNPRSTTELIAGHWGVYPYLPSGNILVTDITEGLFILQANTVRAAWLEGQVTDSLTGFPIVGASISISGGPVAFSNNLGIYETGNPGTGSFQVTCSATGYLSKTIQVSLSNGQVASADFELTIAPQTQIQLTMTDKNTGAPLPFADVLIRNAADTLLRKTNAQGILVDTVQAGIYGVIAGHWGHRTLATNLNFPPNGTQHTLQLDFGYYDDFNFDFGWQVSGDASSGIWERGLPQLTDFQGTPLNPGNDFGIDIGEACFVTGNQGQNATDDEVNDGETILSSPIMDLSKVWNPGMSMQIWFQNISGNFPKDSLSIYVDNGTESVLADQFCCATLGDWTPVQFRLADLGIQATDSMRIRVVAGDYLTNHIVEAGFDHFQAGYYTSVGIAADRAEPTVEFTAGPNPFAGDITFHWDAGASLHSSPLELQLIDLTGKEILRKKLPDSTQSLTLDWEGKGLYLARLLRSGQVLRTLKIVKTQ